jgi:ribosomal protein S18 acetylase RimI-like enzyme
MVEIEHKDSLTEDYYKLIDDEFNKYSEKNGVVCNYKFFAYVAKDNDKVVGIITCKKYYKELYIDDLIVLEEYRHKHIGSQLIKRVEEDYKDSGIDNINLNTYAFQAPDFYQKLGYKVEYIRENKDNPKLNKYYLAKYF